MYVHNATVLEGPAKATQLAMSLVRDGKHTDEQVCLTKKFPLSGTPHVEAVDLCINSQDLHDRLKRATVHWVVVLKRHTGCAPCVPCMCTVSGAVPAPLLRPCLGLADSCLCFDALPSCLATGASGGIGPGH